MFGLGPKKAEAKAQRQTENVLADLRQELQDMDIQLINTTNNRNAVLEKIKYFEGKLPTVVVQTNDSQLIIDKTNGNVVATQEVPAA